MKRYESQMDTVAAYIMPALITFIVIAFFVADYRLNRLQNVSPMFFVSFVLIATMIAMYMYRPKGIVVTNDALIIDRQVKPVTIQYSDIKSVKQVTNELKGSIRTFGNGGLFGYIGKYYNRNIGKMTWYCTQRKNFVLVELNDKRNIIITPDHPQDLLLELKAYTNVSL